MTSVNLENIFPSEKSQAKMATYDMIPLTWSVQTGKCIERKQRLLGAGGKRGMDNDLFHEYKVSFRDDGNVLGLDSGDDCTTLWMC